MEEHDYRWQGWGTPLPDGHRIIEGIDRDRQYRWAIMDNSGDRPEVTDEGILWLDRDRPLLIATEIVDLVGGHGIEHFQIPVITEDGRKAYTPTNARSILMLSRFMRWTIEDESRGHYYTVAL